MKYQKFTRAGYRHGRARFRSKPGHGISSGTRILVPASLALAVFLAISRSIYPTTFAVETSHDQWMSATEHARKPAHVVHVPARSSGEKSAVSEEALRDVRKEAALEVRKILERKAKANNTQALAHAVERDTADTAAVRKPESPQNLANGRDGASRADSRPAVSASGETVPNEQESPATSISALPALDPGQEPVCDRIRYQGGNNSNEPVEFCGPRVVIGGAMRCETGAISKLLVAHPKIHVKRCEKTVDGPPCSLQIAQGLEGTTGLWDQNMFTAGITRLQKKHDIQLSDMTHHPEFMQSLSDALPHLAPDSESVSLLDSPSLLEQETYYWGPELLDEHLPNAHVIFVLCDPVERFWLEYNHMKSYDPDLMAELKTCGVETFSDFVDSALGDSEKCEEKRILRRSIARGEYAESLDGWKDVLGDRVHVVTMNELRGEKGLIKTKKLLFDVGLSPSDFDVEQFWKTWSTSSSLADRKLSPTDAGEPPRTPMTKIATHYGRANAKLKDYAFASEAEKWGEKWRNGGDA